MSEDIDHVILKDCMQRLIGRDPEAGFDLAQLILGDLPNNDVSVLIAIIEGLIHQSEQLGSVHAKEYLDDMWPKMRSMMVRRLKRAGCSDEWDVENSTL